MKSLLLAILLFATPAMAEFQVPALPNPVNDYANVLTRAGKEKIATDIINLKKATGAQAGVLIVNSLDGSSVEEATMASARQWKLGSKDRDDGVLLFIAVKDRKIRLEVGYGLESIVTDYHAKQITASMKSALRSGNYDSAVSTAINGVNARIRAHADEITSKSNAPTAAKPTGESDTNWTFIALGLIGLLGGAGALLMRSNLRRERERAEEESREQRHRDSIEYVKRATQPPVRRPAAEPKASRKPSNSDDDSFSRAATAAAIISSSSSYSSDSSSSYSSSDSSSSSSSDWGGGGGDFGGGGSSDSF